jgi:pyrroloquinoline quinone biosynthesis protein D
VKADVRPQFGKGVRLRREPDGAAMLLVPEGMLELNGTAAAALELVDGNRTLQEIADAVVARFDVTPDDANAGVRDLFERLAERGFVLRRPGDDKA